MLLAICSFEIPTCCTEMEGGKDECWMAYADSVAAAATNAQQEAALMEWQRMKKK